MTPRLAFFAFFCVAAAALAVTETSKRTITHEDVWLMNRWPQAQSTHYKGIISAFVRNGSPREHA